jgi:hypothetical protein
LKNSVALTHGERILPIKVESVAVLSRPAAGHFELLLVTDSDGGVSEIIEADLHELR